MTVPCPGDKRPLAGGGTIGLSDAWIKESFPSGLVNGWFIRFETENNAVVDPPFATGYALCAPRM